MGVIFCINLHLISCASPEGSFSSAEIFYFVFLTSHFLEPWSVALGEAGNFRLRMMNHQMRSACGRTASKTGRQIAISNVQQTYCNILQPIYVQRYYESKFDVESNDIEFRYRNTASLQSTPLACAGCWGTTTKAAARGSGTSHTTTPPSHRTSLTSVMWRTSLNWAHSRSSLWSSWGGGGGYYTSGYQGYRG